MSVDMGHIEAVARVLESMEVAVNYWQRGKPYSDDAVRYCEIFVVILPDGKFKMPVNQLPAGTRKELKMAAERGIPIYTGYNSVMNTSWRIFASIYKEGDSEIAGIAGTSNHLKEYLQNENFVFTKRAPYNLEDNHSSLKIKGERTLQDMLDERFPDEKSVSYIESDANYALRNKFKVSVDPAVKDASDMARLSMSQLYSGLRIPSDNLMIHPTRRDVEALLREDTFPKEKLQEQVKKLRDLEYDERLLLFYKPSK